MRLLSIVVLLIGHELSVTAALIHPQSVEPDIKAPQKCIICHELFEVTGGVRCSPMSSASHFVCDDDLDQYAQVKNQDLLLDIVSRNGKLCCPFRDLNVQCSYVYSDSLLARHLLESTFDNYFENQKRNHPRRNLRIRRHHQQHSR